MKLYVLLLLVAAVTAACVNNCNSHGTCTNGACVCHDGWGGSDCTIWDHSIIPGVLQTGHLNTFQWHYYHIQVENGVTNLQFHVNQTSSVGDIDAFVRVGDYPDTTNHLYEDTTTGTRINFDIDHPQAGLWYIGLYGYWSADYNITASIAERTCAQDCGPHGTCSGTVCVCDDPYTGEACNIYDLLIFSGQTYSDSVESTSWKYYHIDVNEGQVLDITLTQTNSSYDIDLYVKEGARPTGFRFDALNATTAAVTTMHLENLPANTYEIGVFGYRGGSYTIKAVVSSIAPATCFNECSQHGSCSNGVCQCYPGFEGEQCEAYNQNVQIGTTYDGIVTTSFWNYWPIHYFTQSSLLVSLHQTSTGDCDLYVRQENRPTQTLYQKANLGTSSDFSITLEEPGDATWIVGVYGWTSCSYELTVTEIVNCQCVANSHGHCQDGSSVCLCDDGYAGETCQLLSHELRSQAVLTQQSVLKNTWSYYYFNTNSTAVSITMVETATEGDLILAVSMERYPSGVDFDYFDVSVSDFHEVHITWPEATPRRYYIGVTPSTVSVATGGIQYSITAYGTPF